MQFTPKRNIKTGVVFLFLEIIKQKYQPSANHYMELGIDGLLQRTKFTRDQLQLMYRSFKKVSLFDGLLLLLSREYGIQTLGNFRESASYYSSYTPLLILK